MHRHAKPEAITRARALRGGATEHERKLWRKLRELNRIGYHFRRQAPFRGYILDFVEHSALLVVELDGSQHGLPEQQSHDAIRDSLIEGEGYKILRFWNNEMSVNMEPMVNTIVRELELRRPPPDALRASTSPQGGGGF